MPHCVCACVHVCVCVLIPYSNGMLETTEIVEKLTTQQEGSRACTSYVNDSQWHQGDQILGQ